MGGLISLFRDIKTVYKDLKVTLKLTARIVLKVHSIVEDVEETVQELKAAVKGLSSKVYPHDGRGEVAFDALVENVESKAISLKTSLLEATSQVFSEDLLRNTQEKWGKVVEYSKQSTEALATVVANSTFNVTGRSSETEPTSSLQGSVSFSDVKEEDIEEEENHPEFTEPVLDITPVEETAAAEDSTFEILPLEILDSFWKCDIGSFNIDCADLNQVPIGREFGEGTRRMKKKLKKRSKRAKLTRKGALGGAGFWSPEEDQQRNKVPTKRPCNKADRHPRENVALEMIFLIAVLMEGVAMSNRDLTIRGNKWYEGHGRAAEIIELDE